jgi:hypothetical protein
MEPDVLLACVKQWMGLPQQTLQADFEKNNALINPKYLTKPPLFLII